MATALISLIYTAVRIGEKAKITAITSNGQAQTAGLKVLDVSKGKPILTVMSEILYKRVEEGK